MVLEEDLIHQGQDAKDQDLKDLVLKDIVQMDQDPNMKGTTQRVPLKANGGQFPGGLHLSFIFLQILPKALDKVDLSGEDLSQLMASSNNSNIHLNHKQNLIWETRNL